MSKFVNEVATDLGQRGDVGQVEHQSKSVLAQGVTLRDGRVKTSAGVGLLDEDEGIDPEMTKERQRPLDHHEEKTFHGRDCSTVGGEKKVLLFRGVLCTISFMKSWYYRWGQRILAVFRLFGIDLYEFHVRQYTRKKLKKAVSRNSLPLREDGLGLLLDLPALASHSQVGRDFIDKISKTQVPFCVLDTHVPGTSHPRIPDEEEKRYRAFSQGPLDQRRCLHFTTFDPVVVPGLVTSITPFWEFESGLLELHPDFFKKVGRAVVFSDFCYQYLRREMPSGFDLHKLPYPFPLRSRAVDRSAIRRKFSIPLDAFVVFYNFNIQSSFDRKNPLGAMLAFSQAFPRVPETRLVFKISGAGACPGEMSAMRECATAFGIADRMVVITERMTHEDVIHLTGACDAYLSLHRGEGLGLGMLEAMSVDVPVIATAYGGNMDFTTEETAFLVPFQLVPAKTDFPLYQYVREWAEPDVGVALRYLVDLREHGDNGATKAYAAKKQIWSMYGQQNFGLKLKEWIRDRSC